MSQARTTLTPSEAAALQHAFGQLKRGDAKGAQAAVADVLKGAPAAPAALHLYALCQRDSGDVAGAKRSFDAALAATPNDANILSDYGVFLRRIGDLTQASAKLRAALAIAPQRAETWISLSATYLDAGQAKLAAESAERAVTLAPHNAQALLALASAQRESGDLDGAEVSLRTALEHDATNGVLWTALGVVRRLAGDPTDAMRCYEEAQRCGYRSAELQHAIASAHLDLGDIANAIDVSRALTSAAPSYVAGHDLLAQVLWENADAGDDPLAAFAHAVAAQPQHDALREAFAKALLKARRPAEALEHLEVLVSRGQTPFRIAAYATALEQTNQIEKASAAFAAAMPSLGAALALPYAQHLLRVGRTDEAASLALAHAQREPDSQEAWSTLSIAWRLMDDPREHWLCDYERLVMTTQIAPPAGFRDVSEFLQALGETLTAIHVASRAPLAQSLRGGTQSPGVLFSRRDPLIVAAREALHAAVRDALAQLPRDEGHPFLRQNVGDVRFCGSWSVRLRSSGNHVNHFHPEGWLSSAFYVQVPASVRDNEKHAGWIHFGEPPLDSGIALTPRRRIMPEPGKLVLFPSYMLHGTAPFEDEAHRLTIAFDALPAR